jgi:ribonucleoside-diphosphate reductase alpha chain
VLQKDGTRTEEEVVDYAVQLWRQKFGDADLPDYFVNAQTLEPLEHVKMQAAAQKWVDSSISKTINCPEDIGFEAFKDVYMEAYETGCKGCTTYRPNAVTGSVLSVTETTPARAETPKPGTIAARIEAAAAAVGIDDIPTLAARSGVDPDRIASWDEGHKPTNRDARAVAEALGVTPRWLLFAEGEGPQAAAPEPAAAVVTRSAAEPRMPHGDVVYISEPLDRPQALEGQTYKLKWPDSNHAIYITINDIIIGGHRRPFEVFINSKNMEHFAWTVALTRMISAVFRRGGDVSFVVEELKAVFDPRGGAWMNGKYVPSILAAIGGVIERHLIAIGFIAGEGMGLKEDPQAQVVNLSGARGPACPACGQYDMRMIEGCMTCASCGFSRCG